MTDQNPPMMFDFYTHFYQAVASSKANAEYCAKVYGRNLSQHGFAEMDHIDQLIQIGGISPMAPHRKKDIASLGLRAVLGGLLSTLMTATIAGILVG
ncbi:MAG: hypothetical protein HGB14_12200 [Anaerolineaceae bacterium]|nr:hypothetical protein [Anaerolineaceae bacterium]